MSLSKIQTELKVSKRRLHNFGKYKYRSCEDILEAVKPLLRKYECHITMSDDVVEVGGRVYVKATAILQGACIAQRKEGKDAYIVSAYAREPESKKGCDESQITGAASSYARKYALSGLLAIDDTKDPDFNNDKEPDDKELDKKSDQVNQFMIFQAALESCKDLSQLKEEFENINKNKKYISKEQLEKLVTMKDNMKGKLNENAN